MLAKFKNEGQTALEYMLLLMAVVALVLIGFKTIVPKSLQYSNLYFNRVSYGILGNVSSCGDGVCNRPYESDSSCCMDCRNGPVRCADEIEHPAP